MYPIKSEDRGAKIRNPKFETNSKFEATMFEARGLTAEHAEYAEELNEKV